MPVSPKARSLGSPSPSNPNFFRRLIAWLSSPEHFQFKLLLGSVVGVLTILLLAITSLLLTFGHQRQERLRSHTIAVMRLSNVVENDIAALENVHRGFLLTRDRTYLDGFKRLRDSFQKHSQEILAVVGEDSMQRKRVLHMREIVLNWLDSTNLSLSTKELALPTQPGQAKQALGAPLLEEARQILNSIQREEQIVLNHRVREREWAVQSTQVLDFIPKLERAVYEMQKEKRGFLLTGDPAFIDSYKKATADFYMFQGHLSILVADSPAQIAELNAIRAVLEKWIVQCAVPDIEAKRAGQNFSSTSASAESESLMTEVRRLMDQFQKEALEIYESRQTAAAHERLLATSGIDLICILAVGLMIASSGYSFVMCRQQFKNLENAEHRMRSVIDNILDGMITLNEAGVIIAMNPAARRIFEHVDDECVGITFTELVPKLFERESNGSTVAYEWPQLAERTGRSILALARTRTGNTFPVEISLSQMSLEQEKAYVAMIRDVTERQKAEEALAAEKKSLAVTLKSIGDGVITTDLEGKILVFNPASEAMTGWSANEALGRPWKSVFNITTDSNRPPAHRAYRNEAEAILVGTLERSTLTARDGTERIVEQVASPIRDAKNNLCGVVLVFRDITQRLRDENERRKAETLEQLGLLAGGIAHDFNNLLTAIIGNISLASILLPPNSELITRLDDAKNASLRARDLAQQLLTFARGGAPIKKTASIAKTIEDTVSFSLRGSQSRSEIKIQPDLWPAEFDPGQISQVIANMAVNADQAMPDGGTLHVICDNFSYRAGSQPEIQNLPYGDYIRIQMTDEGVGIPEQLQKQIFDPYFTTKPKGNGLGLATTYSIIKNHNGLVTVESQPHCGSTFTIYLPASPKQVIVETVTAPKEPMNGTGRVLIVDDEEAIRALVEFTLGRLGYEVSEAETALKGVELYREALEHGQRFDLVILDLTLPGGMGGKEALKRLIEIDPTVNAIVSSGYAMDSTMSRYQDFGFRGVIAKPYEAAELGRTVREAIESSRLSFEPEYELQRAC